MRSQQTQQGIILLSIILIFSFILSSCATVTPVVPGEIQLPAVQTEVEVPGGLITVEDGSGLRHSVLVFDFEIQSRLVIGAEYAQCVEEGECEPVAETEYPLAPAGVNWYQAQAYCSYLGGRLPTEAELIRATGGEEDCTDSGGELISQEGFGEWVYDWDDPDYYNRSLVANPFGPMYGDLKVAMGLDLDAAGEAMGKYWIKWDELKLDEVKLDEIKLDEIKLDEIKLDEIKLDEIKLDEIKFESYKFFSMGKWEFAKDTWRYSIKFEDGKFFINAESVGMDKSSPDQPPIFPRIGMLPDMSNPLVGFRCVTEGAALTYAPICKTQTAATCNLPPDKMQTISLQLADESDLDPNFQVAGANCPQGGEFALTISHDLPSGEGVEVKAGGKECACQEYTDYPGNLYCSCPSPGAGVLTEIEACQAEEDALVAMDEFCPTGYYYDLQVGGCAMLAPGVPLIYSLVDGLEDSGPSACPSGPGLPVPNTGPLGLALARVEGVSTADLPEGDQWDLFSLSDGSGMCPPGYAFNQETGCCSPYSGENYDCGPDEYFDAGLKQCLPLGWDGCGPCQELDFEGKCIPSDNTKFLSYRCNSDDASEGIDYDEYGRPPEPSEGCAAGAYKDPGLGLCLETRDGCALGYYLDPKTGTCRPISGPESPCPEGYTYRGQTGCCVPSPGTGESECPEGTEWDGAGCTRTVSGCPPTHYYDEETDSCLLREPGECPPGTSPTLFGNCTPDEPGVCPKGLTYDPETDSCRGAGSDQPVCEGGKIFDPALGFCGSTPPAGPAEGLSSGKCDLQDLSEVETVEGSGEDLELSCFDPASALMPISATIDSPEGILQCLLLSANKTFSFGRGLCRPQATGDGETEQYFTIEIEEGRIASITRVEPDQIDPASASKPPLEEVTLCYAGYSIGELFSTGKESDEDDWSEDPVSGTLPGGAQVARSASIWTSGHFSISRTARQCAFTVPFCAIGPTPAPLDKCDGLDFGSCGNTCRLRMECQSEKMRWTDNCTGVASEEKCDAISGCIWQGGICRVD